MEHKDFAAGLTLPVLGAGTWRMGGGFEPDPAADRAAAAEALGRALDAGVTHLDTAEVYAAGEAERIVARALRGRDRSSVVLTSKVWKTNLRHDDVIRSAEASLRRLETDYLDLYLVHMPSDEVPVEETMAALDRLVDGGKVRHPGVCNVSLAELRRAEAAAAHPLAACQLRYNVAHREPEREGLVDHCRRRGIAVVAWRPLRDVVLHPEGCRYLERTGRRRGHTAAQLALRWLIEQPGVVALSTMRDPRHLEENLGALDFRLDAEERAALDAYPAPPATSPPGLARPGRGTG